MQFHPTNPKNRKKRTRELMSFGSRFQQIRFKNDMVFGDLRNTKGCQTFKEIGKHKRSQFQRTFAAEFFNRSRIDMRESQIQSFLVSQAQGEQIRTLGTDISKKDMVVFEGAFLTGLHGVTVKDSGAAGTISRGFHGEGSRKL